MNSARLYLKRTKLDKSKNIVTPGSQVDPRDVWMSQSSQQMKEMDNVIQGLKMKLAEVEQKQAAPQAPSRPASVLSPLPPMPPAQAQAAIPGALPAGPAASTGRPTPAVPPPLPPLPTPVVPKEPALPRLMSVTRSPPAPQGPDEGKQGKTYIPSGSFMRVALMGGLDAPTGGQARNNPWPTCCVCRTMPFFQIDTAPRSRSVSSRVGLR